ncbi:MAG: hypothetical protein JW716_05335 [Candidatus Aenigmarchaeota archaeon]|nr:hypothetical protein [Candidatus Aenigmarchaeota archaeon]
MVRSVVSKVRKMSERMAEAESSSDESRMRILLDFDKDYFGTLVDTKSDVLDKHLTKLARRVGFLLNLQQEKENPDFQGTGHLFGTALGKIIETRHGTGTFLRGKSIYSDGKCSSMFALSTNLHSPAGSMDIRMMGEKEHAMGRELEDFLVGLCDGMKFHVNIVLEKVDDKNHEWESVFESMTDSLRKIL